MTSELSSAGRGGASSHSRGTGKGSNLPGDESGHKKGKSQIRAPSTIIRQEGRGGRISGINEKRSRAFVPKVRPGNRKKSAPQNLFPFKTNEWMRLLIGCRGGGEGQAKKEWKNNRILGSKSAQRSAFQEPSVGGEGTVTKGEREET